MVSYISALLSQARQYFTGDIAASRAIPEDISSKPLHINSFPFNISSNDMHALYSRNFKVRKSENPLNFSLLSQADLSSQTELCLNGCTKLSERELLNIFEKMPNLTAIKISGVLITDETLSYISSHYPNLVELDVSKCARLTTSGFNSLAEGCNKIEKLNTSFVFNILDGGYNQFLEANPTLSEWKVTNSYAIGISTLTQLRKNQCLTTFNPSPSLIALMDNQPSRDSAFSSFIESCTSLKKLNLEYGWQDLTDNSLQAISTYSKELQYLNLGYSSDLFTSTGVTKFFQNIPPQLQTFLTKNFKFAFNDEQLTQIFTAISNSNIKKLGMGGLMTCSSETLNLIQDCKGLEHLELIGTKENLTDQELATIVNNLPHLNRLELLGKFEGSFLTLIKNPKLSAVIINNNLEDITSWVGFNNPALNLKIFAMNQAKVRDPSSLFDFVQANPELEELSFYQPNAFSSEQVLQLNHQNLKMLKWLADTTTTEQALAKFIHQNPELMDFWYPGENGSALMSALANLKYLKYVNIKIPHENNLDSSLPGSSLSCLGKDKPRVNKMQSAYLTELGGDPNLVPSLQSFMRSNHLLSFGINDCTLSGDNLVEALTADPTPTSLGLSDTPNLDYNALDQILQGLPALISINIAGDNSLTSTDITNLQAKYPWVEVAYYSIVNFLKIDNNFS